MSIQFINAKFHGLLDYGAAIVLIIPPFVFNLQAESVVGHWLSVAGGVGLIIYSLMTDYRFSITGIFSFSTHLLLDLSASALFLIAPFVLEFSGFLMVYYLVMGSGVIVVVALSQREKVSVGRSAA